ncbi:MAG: PKD domain-containing protein [Phaeodactylibacter sp.]|nr:PKD domain-containing protein [Phaeodactylibacter sp.]
MKLRLCFLLLAGLVSPILLSAQITIDASDVPPFGALLTTATDTLVAGLQAGPSGAGQSWDFSALAGQESTTNLVVDPAETPNGAAFPQATFAFQGADDFYSYAQVTADALLGLGGSASLVEGVGPVVLEFSPPQQLLPVPATFGSSFNNTYAFNLQLDGSVINPLVDSVRVASSSSQSATIDAAGMLVLPDAAYETLRQRVETITETAIEIKFFGAWTPFETTTDTTIAYEWWAKDGRGLVLSLDFDAQGNTLDATYLTDYSTGGQMAPVAAFSLEILEDGQVQFTDESENQPEAWQWDFGDGLASTEQNPLHTYQASGLYTACLTAVNGAGQSTACQDVDVVVNGANEAARTAGLKAYPSPARDVLFLEFGALQGKPVQLCLVNALGQQLSQHAFDKAPSEAWSLDISGLQPGLYRAVLKAAGQRVMVLPFVKG